MVIRPIRKDGLVTLGLPDRIRLRGKSARGPGKRIVPTATRVSSGTQLWSNAWDLPVYVYCPRPGPCGIGQMLEQQVLL